MVKSFARDTNLGDVGFDTVRTEAVEDSSGILETLKRILTTSIVACPITPMRIPGVGVAIYGGTAAIPECLGTIAQLRVPKRGIIVSATFFDLDDEGSQVDLEIFKALVTQNADNAAWTLSAANNPFFITEIAFFAFDDQIASQTSEVKNIGKGYTAPDGILYIQAITRATPTIAVAPRFQLQIQSFDPDFEES